MAISPEAQSKVALWRQKAREGTLTQEERREAIKVLREDRIGAAQTSTASRAKKAPKAPINADDLLAELGGL